MAIWSDDASSHGGGRFVGTGDRERLHHIEVDRHGRDPATGLGHDTVGLVPEIGESARATFARHDAPLAMAEPHPHDDRADVPSFPQPGRRAAGPREQLGRTG